MEGVIGVIVIFGVCFAVVHFYSKFLMSGMASRTIVTSASPAQVRDAFVRKVAGSTWKIVDDGNPMIAQSPLVTGIRQQIGLEVRQEGGQVQGLCRGAALDREARHAEQGIHPAHAPELLRQRDAAPRPRCQRHHNPSEGLTPW